VQRPPAQHLPTLFEFVYIFFRYVIEAQDFKPVLRVTG
jgi:hypothetical protein